MAKARDMTAAHLARAFEVNLRTRLPIVSIVALLFLLAAGHLDASAAGTFNPTGAMKKKRYMNTTTLLNDGKVLVAGGRGQSLFPYGEAELFDPGSGTFDYTGTMIEPRAEHRANRLPDGRVLITGGRAVNAILSQAEVYDPASGTFSPTGAMTASRADFTATSLADGRVLLAGGLSPLSLLSSAEIYNPATGIFTATGSMAGVRFNHAASLLPDGRVLVVGGKSGTSDILSTAEVYNPATGTFSVTGPMGEARAHFTATLLPNGKVLVAGGSLDSSNTVKATAELYDPGTGTFSPTGAMSFARQYHTATLLADGRVLMAGGADSSNAAEVYDPATGTFSTTGGMSVFRNVFGASLLPDGRVLMAGGQLFSEPSAEVFSLDPEPQVPVVGETVKVEAVAGKVSTKCRGESSFTRLRSEDLIEVGCQVDTRVGTVGLTSAAPGERTQRASFTSGIFRVSQGKRQAETTLTLTEPLRCGKRRTARSGGATSSRATVSGGSSRRLWGSGKGRFKTKGNKGSASVRGTRWLVEDRCDGTTLFKVARGVVAVRDDVRRKTIMLKAGKSYVAGKKRRR